MAAPFLAGSLVWVALSDLGPQRFELARRLTPHKFALDCSFVVAILAVFFGAIRILLAKNAATTRLLREQLRAYRLLTECESSIWRARDRVELLTEICRLAVTVGGYRLAWVGRGLHDEKKSVRVVARAGHDDGYIDALDITWDDTPRGRGPSGTCIRSGTAQICRYMDDDPRMAPWREAARRCGLRSCATFPVRKGHERTGSVTFYSEQPDAFDSAETELLQRLADSMTYALDHLDNIETERKLVAELKTLAYAIDSSPVSVIITNPAGNIEFVNRKFSAVTGYRADEVRGKNPRVLKSGETSPEEYRRLWEMISRGETWTGVLHNRRKNGDSFWEHAVISPILGENGKVQHYIAVKEDITEKRSLEQQLRQAQKMESLGILAGGVAHDFNNLLTVIEGHCELLSAAGLPNVAARESVAEILGAAGRASAMTRRLLQFGRKQPLRTRVADLGAIVWDSTRLLQRLIGESSSVRIERPAEPLSVRVDPGMIEQALMNLAVNARDAMPGGGPITISVSEAPIGLAPPPDVLAAPEGFALLSVSDRGCGIPAGDLQRIFEPFFTTKGPGKGTGLGLAVVDGIVRQHHGWIEVDSEVGKGTLVSLYLPRETQKIVGAPAPASAAAPRGTESLLLVEDEPPLRALAARVLRDAGYTVTEAASGPDALRALEKLPSPVRLVVTDMVMPGNMTGIELSRILRKNSPDLRVIVMSGYHPELPLDSSTIGDGFRFLSKPFKPSELAQAVRAELDRS